MKDIMKMTAALIIFSTVACVALAFVYEGTAKTIAVRQKADMEAALKGVFPDADSFTDITEKITSGDKRVTFDGKEAAFAAQAGGKTIGVAVKAATPGFNDAITALVGVGANGKIAGVKILSNTDTPGLGANAGLDKYYVNKAKGTTFYGQFTGMSANGNIMVQKDGGDVVAITAATITSRAVSLLVKTAAEAALTWLKAEGSHK